MKTNLEDLIVFVPLTKHKLVIPLLMEANYYETMRKYTREQVIEHMTQKYKRKEEPLPSRYNITVK